MTSRKEIITELIYRTEYNKSSIEELLTDNNFKSIEELINSNNQNAKDEYDEILEDQVLYENILNLLKPKKKLKKEKSNEKNLPNENN